MLETVAPSRALFSTSHLERWRVIDSIACHGHAVAHGLEFGHNGVLVLGEHTCKGEEVGP